MFVLRKASVRTFILRVSHMNVLDNSVSVRPVDARNLMLLAPRFAYKKFSGKRAQQRDEDHIMFDNQTSDEEQNIVQLKLRAAFKTDSEIAAGDWDKLMDSILGLPIDRQRLVNQVNITSVILKACEELDRIKVARSFSEHIGLMEKSTSNLYPLLRAVLSCQIKDEDDFVIQVAKKFTENDNILTVQLWCGIQALAKTKDWRSAMELYKNDTRLTVNDGGGPIGVHVASDLAIKALDQGEEAIMWEIMEHPHFHEHNIPLRDTAGLGHRHRERVFKTWISHCSRFKDRKKALEGLETLFLYLEKYGLHLSKEILYSIKELYEGNLKAEKCAATITKISHTSGTCFNCEETLKKEEFTAKELQDLKSSILDIVLKGEDTYQNTNPKELDFFLQMLKKQGKFDVVMDGLNVALTRIPGCPPIKPLGLSSINLLETILYFHKQGKRILVIHRPSIKNYPHYSQILELSHLHILDNLTQDDPYFILAALHSGNNCLCVTSDLLRQHLVRLANHNPELGKLFNRWQVAHQVYVTGFEKLKSSYSGKPGLIFPPKYTVGPNKTNSHWHVPLLTEPGKNPVQERTIYHGYAARWLCAGPEVADGQSRGVDGHSVGVDSRKILDRLGNKKKERAKGGFKVKNVFDS